MRAPTVFESKILFACSRIVTVLIAHCCRGRRSHCGSVTLGEKQHTVLFFKPLAPLCYLDDPSHNKSYIHFETDAQSAPLRGLRVRCYWCVAVCKAYGYKMRRI